MSFVSTLHSAALMVKIREGCLQGRLEFCNCSDSFHNDVRINETHILESDCGEFRKFPSDMARKFTDKPLLPAYQMFYLPTAVMLHNYLLGRKVSFSRDLRLSIKFVALIRKLLKNYIKHGSAMI